MTLRWSCKHVALLWLTGSFILHSQYHGCWCTGDASSQGIGSHSSDLWDFSGSVPYGLRLAASNVILYCQLNEHKLFDTVFYWWFLFNYINQLGDSYTYLTQNVLHIDMDLIISAMFIIWNMIPQNHPVFCRNKFNKWATTRWVASWRPWSPNPPLHRPARPTGPTGWWHELTYKLLKSFYWWSHVWWNGAWNEQVCQSVPPR